MKQVVRKLKSDRRGFSMVELLVVLLILVLVTGVIVGGLPMVQKAHRDVVDGANAQAMLSTVMTRLRDELGTASQVSVTDGAVDYIAAGGVRANICQNDGNIWLRYPGLTGNNIQPLVPDGAAQDGLSVVYESIDVVSGVVTFHGLAVRKDGAELAGMEEFCIRIISGG